MSERNLSIKELKDELGGRSRNELLALCLRLARFKKENKELLGYILFESADEQDFIKRVKGEIDLQFDEMNVDTAYFIKKSTRKILKNTRKYIRYSGKKETEVELLIYFCFKMKEFPPPIRRIPAMKNLFERLIASIKKTMLSLHEDLQFDYGKEVEELLSPVIR
jgi:hypothetical protein